MLINLLNTKPSVVADGAVFFLNPEPSVFPEKTTPEIAEYLEHQCLLDKNLIEVHQGKNECENLESLRDFLTSNNFDLFQFDDKPHMLWAYRI